jgi:alginate O-acetyltransferase complex protein AlgI
MQFHSLKFFIFFCVVFGVYWSAPGLVQRLLPNHLHHWGHRCRKIWLLLASGYFYALWNAWLVGLILFSATVDYLVAIRLETVLSRRKRLAWLVFSIGTNLSLLAYFKYTNFFLDTACSTLNVFGFHCQHRTFDIVVPLGISFYTFETISYVLDVNRGLIKALRNPLDYALYIMFFPHLLSGPIVRPRDFLPQLQQRKRFDWDRLQFGLQFFLMGLFKKAVIADIVGTNVVQPVFANPGAYSSLSTWLAVLCYALQIYCDFSGYSDMAIGVAHSFGYKLPFNFNMPYFAANISEFWRRWHISLSTWLRDYLYIPLGGNRGGEAKTYRNLLATMLLGGLWHGANWTFVAWGFYHGLLLAAHRLFNQRQTAGSDPLSLVFHPVRVAITFLSVCVGWVFFRAQTFSDAAVVLSRMFWPTDGQMLAADVTLAASALLILVLACHLIGALVDLNRIERRLPAPLLGASLAALLLLVQLLMPENGAAFIYFQF